MLSAFDEPTPHARVQPRKVQFGFVAVGTESAESNKFGSIGTDATVGPPKPVLKLIL